MTVQAFWQPIQLSFQVTSLAVTIVTIFGILIGWFMSNHHFKGKTAVETLILLPVVLPPTVVGFLLVVVFGGSSIIGQLMDYFFNQSIMFTMVAAVIAAVVVSFPLMYQSVKTGFDTVDQDVENAGRVDGANEWKVLWYITLPLCYKSMITGVVLSFARAIGEFGATMMFAGNIPGKTQTIPTAIYVAMESNRMSLAWAWVIAIVVISYLALFLLRRSSK
ncbi:molybdate ABC transporter permease subunit [Aquibacillus sediminis]|uniref:molybdate ABC transporter permease subunit n=1 Tax=Aquibacillus sediminis TaxID=2574734 RepID=UPI0011099260|nr:molybdate ABC transporter permease subunit [Aquibacillus sediminis]